MARIEFRTIGLLVLCYAVWGASTWSFVYLKAGYGLFFAAMVLFAFGAVASAFHTSLQHEVVHGHPTPWPVVNELLVFPSLIVVYPFRRYRQLHLKHHHDAHLTDPYEDPESYFWPHDRLQKMNSVMRLALEMNNTFVGRMVLGPLLGVSGFFRSELVRLRAGEAGVRAAWGLHVLGVAMVFVWVSVICGIPLWVYLLAVVYPGVSWMLVRSFAEHRAAETIGGRTAIVEANRFLSLLFLNNNLHVVHHAHPDVAWYELPTLYRQRKDHYLTVNQGYFFNGYGEVVRRYAFRQKQPVAYPALFADAQARDGKGTKR